MEQIYKKFKSKSKYGIDSLKLKIRKEKVEILDYRLNETLETYSSTTGDLVESFQKNTLRISDRGITTTYKLTREYDVSKRAHYEYCCVLFNAKILQEWYFDGINVYNLRLIYEMLMGYEVVKFDYQTFLNSKVVDIDIKMDYIMPVEDFRTQLDLLKKLTPLREMRDTGCHRFNDEGNVGLEFAKRTTKNYEKYPYMKFYHKELELNYKSNEFRAEFLDSINVDNIARCEITIKGKKHFLQIFKDDKSKWFDLFQQKGNTLHTVAMLTHKDNKALAKKCFQNHFRKHLSSKRDNERVQQQIKNLKGKDVYIYILMELLLEKVPEEEKDLEVITIVSKVENMLGCRMMKSRWKKLIYDKIMAEKRVVLEKQEILSPFNEFFE